MFLPRTSWTVRILRQASAGRRPPGSAGHCGGLSFPTARGPGWGCPFPPPPSTMGHAHPRALALPTGSLLSRLMIRCLRPRLFSPRHLFGKECSPGAVSHPHPGGCAKFSRERFHQVATCHLWTERGNCSRGVGESGGTLGGGVSPTPHHSAFIHSMSIFGAPAVGHGRPGRGGRGCSGLCPPGSLSPALGEIPGILPEGGSSVSYGCRSSSAPPPPSGAPGSLASVSPL